MGSFGVVFADEVVESSLLLKAVHLRRSCCFFLQGQVHALMAAVLLGLAGLDALDIAGCRA